MLKNTPHDHIDRKSLNMALTELENVAQCLNETKRVNDDKHIAKQFMELLKGNHPLKQNPDRYLIKQETVYIVSIFAW